MTTTHPLVLVPQHNISLGMAWASSSVNCKTYAAEGIVSRAGRSFGAFFDAEGALTVYKVDERCGTLTTRKFARTRLPHDAHDTPACNLDSSGRLHVFSSAHVSRPTYLRGEPGGDLADLQDCSSELPACLDKISYPSLVQAPGQGDLLLIYREGLPANSAWNVVRCSLGRSWSNEPLCVVQGRLGAGTSIGPYINLPIIFGDGRIGLAIVWRSDAVEGGREGPVNRGIDYVELASGARGLRSAEGLAIPLPLTPLTAECAWPVAWGVDLINQSGACVEAGERPVIAAAWRGPHGKRTLHLLRHHSDGSWYSQRVASFAGDFRLAGNGTLPTPQSRPVVVPVRDAAIAVIYRTSCNGGRLMAHIQPCASREAACGRKVVLIDGGLDQYEPVAERFQSRHDGKLRMYIQKAAQRNSGDRPESLEAAASSFMMWDLNDVLDQFKDGLLVPARKAPKYASSKAHEK